MRKGDNLEPWGTVGEALATGHFTGFYRIQGSLSGPLVAEILIDDFARIPKIVEVFRSQALRWSSVRHPALATPVGTGRLDGGNPFAVVEAIDGIPLTAYLAQGQRFPSDLIAALLQQLLEALIPIHRVGLSHGAITTSRITLVRRDSGSFAARLRGFGRRALASEAGADAFDALSRLDAVSYASPDVARGGAIDDDADRWALAVLAYELLTGRAPCGGPTPFARYQAIVRHASAISLTLPAEAAALGDFFSMAFAPKRNQRFASTEGMLDALLQSVTPRSVAVLGDLPASIEPPTVAPPSAPTLLGTAYAPPPPPSPRMPAPTQGGKLQGERASKAGLESTLNSDAPAEVVAALLATRGHGGTLRSALPSTLEVEEAMAHRSSLSARVRPWLKPRVLMAFALGLSCGLFLGVWLLQTVLR